MINTGLYVFFEGYILEVVSEMTEHLIIEKEQQYILLPRKNHPQFSLDELLDEYLTKQ